MRTEQTFSLDDFSEYRLSAWVLVAANVVPLAGVLLWDWSTFAIVAIYWSENVVLGAINLLKMLFCSPNAGALASTIEELGVENLEDEEQEKLKQLMENHPTTIGLNHVAKLFFMPFFAVHYGMFCFVHGVFVFVLLGRDHRMDFPSPWAMFERLHREGLLWAVAVLAGSHFVSFLVNYLVRGEYRRCTLATLMMQPYGRIVALHLAILLGAFATLALGSPVSVLIILIAGKTVLDLKLHLRERRKNLDEQRRENYQSQQRGNEGFGAGAE